VQDFEPYFEPVGSYSTFAENTYRFGFHGITLGEWLSKKLTNEYDMKCDYIKMGTDVQDYKLLTKANVKKFYTMLVQLRRVVDLSLAH
jgi:hypothetical protein